MGVDVDGLLRVKSFRWWRTSIQGLVANPRSLLARELAKPPEAEEVTDDEW